VDIKVLIDGHAAGRGTIRLSNPTEVDMHRIPSFVLGAVVAFTLTAGAWSVLHSAPVAPAAADRKLGVAHMSAIVTNQATAFRGTGIVSVARVQTGEYDLLFERSLEDCAMTAMPASTFGFGGVGFAFASGLHKAGVSGGYTIFLNNASGAAFDTPFNVVAFCHK
jgi:hypothetical protein